MYMRNSITITSKGQATIPAFFRRKLGVGANGGKLDIRFNEEKNEIVITKPLTIDGLSEKISSYIKPKTQPLVDVDAYYQTHREGHK